MLRENLQTSVMGGLCDRPDAAACDYRLTYRSSQMVRTGAAKTKQCCEHMISATTTRELSTGMSPQMKLTSRGLVIIAGGLAGSGPVDARYKHTTQRAPSEMVTWWMPSRRLLGRARSGPSCGWKGTRTRRSRVVCAGHGHLTRRHGQSGGGLGDPPNPQPELDRLRGPEWSSSLSRTETRGSPEASTKRFAPKAPESSRR
jgi:hypothetical protein